MGLVACKSCKHQVDSSAKTCPQCGVADPGVSTLQKLAGLAVLAVIIVVLLVTCSSDDESPAVSAPAAAPAEAIAPPAQDAGQATLGIKPTAYADRLNTLLADLELKHRVDATRITVGQVNDVLNAPIGKHAALVASISKTTGEVIDLTVIGSGDGTPASGLEIMMVAAAALTAATDGVEFSEVFEGLPAMIKGQERRYGAIKLGAKNMDQMGTWFFASPVAAVSGED